MKTLTLLLPLVFVGCIRTPYVTPGTVGLTLTAPPTQAQIDSCESKRTWHNVFSLSALFFSGAAGVQGATEAAEASEGNKSAQVGLGIGAASASALALIATAAAGMESDNYSMSNCSAVLSAAPR